MDITDLSVTVTLRIAAPVPEVFEALADPVRTARWSPECVRISWLDDRQRAAPGARFHGHNKAGEREWDVTCEITEVRPPERISWVVLGFANDPATPSSTWTYTTAAYGDDTLVTGTFRHGAGGSHLVNAMAARPEQAETILGIRRESLRKNMHATLTAMATEYGWRTVDSPA